MEGLLCAGKERCIVVISFYHIWHLNCCTVTVLLNCLTVFTLFPANNNQNSIHMKPFLTLVLSSFLFFISETFAQPTLSFTPVITGMNSPVQVVNAGDGSNRMFIVLQVGDILVYDKTYSSLGTFLSVTNLGSGNERGLLSMAFHPAYASNGLFYVYYTNSNGDLELARYKVSANPNIADPSSKVILITIPHPTNANHNGGELHFGNDGDLYLSTGDGGGAGDVPNNAQNTGVLLGKILRFAVNTSLTAPYYTIPPDNPYANEIYSFGLRNPFRWSFDRETYDMWIGDVGQDSYEEIDYRPLDSSKNVNYGWHCYEGNAVYNNTGTGCGGSLSNYTFPVYTFPTAAPATAVIGGTVYRGNTYIAFRGYYVATEFYTGTLYLVKYNTITHTATTTVQAPVSGVTGISDFGETEDGELYAVSLITGYAYRVTSDGPIGYTFTGNGNWNDAANWSNNTIPTSPLPAGAEIIIDPVANGECVLNVTQVISAGAKFNVKTNKSFRDPGNLILQ